MEVRVKRSDELYHYGVLGMKWGVRRYQKKDGALTGAGKKRITKTVSAYASDHYLNVKRDRIKQKESTTNRDALPVSPDWFKKAMDQEREKLMKDRKTLKEAGYIFKKNIHPMSTEAEHNKDLFEYLLSKQPGVKAAERKYAEWYLNTRADATLADLSLQNTEPAKAFVKERLLDDVLALRRYMHEGD